MELFESVITLWLSSDWNTSSSLIRICFSFIKQLYIKKVAVKYCKPGEIIQFKRWIFIKSLAKYNSYMTDDFLIFIRLIPLILPLSLYTWLLVQQRQLWEVKVPIHIILKLFVLNSALFLFYSTFETSLNSKREICMPTGNCTVTVEQLELYSTSIVTFAVALKIYCTALSTQFPHLSTHLAQIIWSNLWLLITCW